MGKLAIPKCAAASMRCAVCMYSICSSDKIFSGVLRIIVTMHIYANMHICFRLFWGIITFAQFVPEERKPEGFQLHQMLSDQLLLSGEAMAALNLNNRNILHLKYENICHLSFDRCWDIWRFWNWIFNDHSNRSQGFSD